MIPSLEYDNNIVEIEDSSDIQDFLSSDEFSNAQMKPRKIGVVLLDLVEFSSNQDETQLKLIVMYQSIAKKISSRYNIDKIISIGDGSIFIFEKEYLSELLDFVIYLDHELAGFNLDYKFDNVTELNWRIGIHVGDAYCFKDINEEYNYVGSGVNIAQRISMYLPKETQEFFKNTTTYISDVGKRKLESFDLPDGLKFIDAGVINLSDKSKDIKIHAHAVIKCTCEN